MILFNFLVFALIAAVVALVIAAFAIPFIGLFFAGLWKRSWWMTVPGGLLAGIILLAACAPFVLLIYGFLHPWMETEDPKEIRSSFTAIFHLEPGPDFVPLHKKDYSLADSGYMQLTFKVSPETFDKMVAAGFEKIPAEELLDKEEDGDNLPWWSLPDRRNGDCFHNPKGALGYKNGAYLYYDRTTGTAYLYAYAID